MSGTKLSSFNYRVLIFATVTITGYVAAQFPLESPCLRKCPLKKLTPEILQKCIDECKTLGHCCGNRLNGECPSSSNERLSCANGCEIAYYRSTVDQCKADCDQGNKPGCMYVHSNIESLFKKCGDCQETCDIQPDLEACYDGCDLAASLSNFYQYTEISEGTCVQDNIPRFLFAGQSNMIGHSEHAIPNSFGTMIEIINSQQSKQVIKSKLRRLFLQGRSAEVRTSKNEARMIYAMRSFMKKNEMMNDHPTSTCSFTIPSNDTKDLDCERAVSSTACGNNHEEYGPELMFAHAFPKLNSPLKGQAIGITKVAVGGTEIYKNWMKDNKDQDQNYWYALVDAIKATKGSLQAFVWFQGENDTFIDWNKKNYQINLTKFIADVRKEIFDTSTTFKQLTDIPVIIVELGRWIWSGNHYDVIEAQRAFVENDPSAYLVATGAGSEKNKRLSAFYHYDIASQIIIGRRIASAMKILLNLNQ